MDKNSEKESFSNIDMLVDDLNDTGEERDPERIAEIIEQLEIYWENNPDLRISQIISNIAQENNLGKDPYYMSDKIVRDSLYDRNN